MNSLVIQIQEDCVNGSIPVTQILRKHMVLAKKLQIADIAKWLDFELEGYSKFEDLPEYRRGALGQLRYFNPYHGWQSVIFDNDAYMESICRRNIFEGLPELETLISTASTDDVLMMHVPDAVANHIRSKMPFNPEVMLHLSKNIIRSISERVRTNILNQAIELERQGVLGENMLFTDEEKQRAAKNANSIINIYGNIDHGVISSGDGNAISINSNSDLSALKAAIGNIDAAFKSAAEFPGKSDIGADLATAHAQINKDKPNFGVIKSCLDSINGVVSSQTTKDVIAAAGTALNLLKTFAGA